MTDKEIRDKIEEASKDAGLNTSFVRGANFVLSHPELTQNFWKGFSEWLAHSYISFPNDSGHWLIFTHDDHDGKVLLLTFSQLVEKYIQSLKK